MDRATKSWTWAAQQVDLLVSTARLRRFVHFMRYLRDPYGATMRLFAR
jgi:hypothetical protein